MYVRYLPRADWMEHFMGPEDRYYVIVKTDKNEVISSKNLSTANVIYTLMVCFKCSVFIENLLLCICRNIFVENVVLFFDVSLWRYECTSCILFFYECSCLLRFCIYSKLFWMGTFSSSVIITETFVSTVWIKRIFMNLLTLYTLLLYRSHIIFSFYSYLYIEKCSWKSFTLAFFNSWLIKAVLILFYWITIDKYPDKITTGSILTTFFNSDPYKQVFACI